MLFNVLRRFPDIIEDIQVKRFRHLGASYELLAEILLRNQSSLYLKEYLFLDGTRKYAYHWQEKNGRFIGRWDNAPHWSDLPDFPHHYHDGSEENVRSSKIKTIEDVLQYIRDELVPEG